MTHQLEIWHSEESERIWASFRRFGTHYLLMKWAQIYYDDTIIDNNDILGKKTYIL